MEKIKIDLNINDFPASVHPFMQGAAMYDSSCSDHAKVYYSDLGYYIKVENKGLLEGEAKLVALFAGLVSAFVEKIAPFLPEKDIAADIYITHTRRVLLVDLNSWGGNTDAKMLKWEQLQETQKPVYGIVPPPWKISGQLEVKF